MLLRGICALYGSRRTGKRDQGRWGQVNRRQCCTGTHSSWGQETITEGGTVEYIGEDNGTRLGKTVIKVIGVGGGGCNAVNRMYQLAPIEGVDYLCINTDVKHLSRLVVTQKMPIGNKLTRGLGVGGKSDLGREAAEENRDELYELLRGADMVFVAAGMGGGTGTGAAPIIAEIAKETGALTIGVVTKPFKFEGHKRRTQAEDGILRMKEKVDSVIVIPNDRLLELARTEVTTDEAFRLADDVLRQGVQAIAQLVTVAGEINLDFADVKSIMAGAGTAWMSVGSASGQNRAVEAARMAIESPLLDVQVNGAKGILLSITGGPDLTLSEVHKAAELVESVADPDANIIFGMSKDPSLEDEVGVTIIATGFPPVGTVVPDDDLILSQLELGGIKAEKQQEEEQDVPAFLRRNSPLRRPRGRF
ncbi:MAG: cell division protein FtsZ [Chloroflexi bacterium]|nr:cell division protein FtsZ [Chloroflexota bacterium]